ncbi:MAG: restriction endonuclease subunit S [Chloroflexi bacterium]|nr:restriction endonuclease subunit S [Chloroflexota bacterium]
MLQNKSSHWAEVPIGEILKYLDEKVVFDDMAEYITITVKRRHGGLEAREKLFGHEIKTKKQYRLHRGAFIISRVQCWHAAFAIVPDDIPENMIASQNYDQFEISPKVDRRFFWWLSHSQQFIETVRSSASGVVIEKLVFNRDAWLQKTIPIPPLDEQRQIVAHIESLAARVNEAQRLREKIQEEISAFIASYHVFYSDKVVKLGDILTLDEYKEVIKPEGNYPQIGVKGFGKGLFARETLSGTETTYKWFNRLYYGAVVLSQVKGWEGAIGVVDKSLVGKFASPEYRTFRCKPDQALSEYLSELIATPWFYFQLKTLSRGVGGRRERVRPELFVELEIPMPDIERQKQAVEIFATFPALRELQSQSQEELDALLPSVLDRAFRGQ